MNLSLYFRRGQGNVVSVLMSNTLGDFKMNVNVTTVNKHVSNIDFVDIDVISEEEAQAI